MPLPPTRSQRSSVGANLTCVSIRSTFFADKNMTRRAQRMKGPPCIVSGGQTGVERASLGWAIRRALPYAGWCPKGRRAEDGTIPRRYRLRETPSPRYAQRTEWNVRDSDGTVIFSSSRRLVGGSVRTLGYCSDYGKPVLHLASALFTISEAALFLTAFLRRYRIRRLNVAGPRRSQDLFAGKFARSVLDATFGFTLSQEQATRGL